MEKLDVHPRIIRALRKARITRLNAVLETSNADLCRQTKLSLKDINSLMKAVSSSIARPAGVTALNLLKGECHELQKIHKLSLGCPILDAALNGGLLSQGITEIAGESSSGKTQICLQLCLTVQLPYTQGGLHGAAVYISTEDIFPSKRLHQMIPAFQMKYDQGKNLSDNIYIEHAADVTTLMQLMQNKIPKLIEKINVRLIVLDSIAALIRVEYSYHEMAQRSKILNQIGAKLRELSYKNNIPVVCVNQVSAVLDCKSKNDDVHPCLGLTWSNLITVRLMLSKYVEYVEHNQQQRKLQVIFAPHLPKISCLFVVDQAGIHGLN